MGTMQNYRDLIAWQKGMDLVEEIYRISAQFPDDERFGLTSQIRRAAVSIPSNIAEGHSRPRNDYLRFLNIARGSLSEVETQLEIAQRLKFIENNVSDLQLTKELGKILNGLIRSLKT